MDFLPIFLAYVMLFGMATLLFLFSNTSPLLSSVLEHVKEKLSQVISASVPHVIIRCVNHSIHYVFNTRNHVMQVMFGLLVVGGNAILMLDVLPLLYIFEPDQNHILLPLVFLFSNLAAFHLSCTTHPGWVSSSNAALLASLYKADGLMFKDGTHCRTCKLVKPPRSKHCNICNGCVHRFDHHCIWTNNCVGAGNLRFFLPFLLTLMAMVVNGMVMGGRSLYLLVVNLRMMESDYVDTKTGQVAPVTIPILIQHLFMQYPRCVFLVTSLMMLTLLLGLFTLYHLFLVIHNQTTNERYKIAEITASFSRSSHDRKDNQDQQLKTTLTGCLDVKKIGTLNDKARKRSNCKSQSMEYGPSAICSEVNGNCEGTDIIIPGKLGHRANFKQVKSLGAFYNRGILLNLKEVFLPWLEYNKLKKEASVSVVGNGNKQTIRQRSGRR